MSHWVLGWISWLSSATKRMSLWCLTCRIPGTKYHQKRKDFWAYRNTSQASIQTPHRRWAAVSYRNGSGSFQTCIWWCNWIVRKKNMTAMLWRSFHAFRSGMKSEIRCSACVFDGFLLHTVTQSHFHSKQVAKQAAIAFSYQLHIAEKQSAGYCNCSSIQIRPFRSII